MKQQAGNSLRLARVRPGLRAALALLLAAALTPAMADGDPPPSMEAGIGAAALMVPSYRGSDHYGTAALPLPYFIYRSERVRLSRDGLRIKMAALDHFSIGLSGAFSYPGRNDDPARAGMPKLLPTFEAGPSLDWRVYSGASSLCICVPVRAVLATNLRHAENAGWVLHPQLQLGHFNMLGDWGMVSSFSIGPVFADRRYQAYFYDVAPQYATADRPEYHSSGGYTGARSSVFLNFRHDRWSVGGGVIGDWLDGASMDDSPLVKTRSSATVAIGVSYRLWARNPSLDAEEPVEK